MFIVTIDGTDSSSHTQIIDAEAQMQRFIDAGATDVAIIEKDVFNPEQ